MTETGVTSRRRIEATAIWRPPPSFALFLLITYFIGNDEATWLSAARLRAGGFTPPSSPCAASDVDTRACRALRPGDESLPKGKIKYANAHASLVSIALFGISLGVTREGSMLTLRLSQNIVQRR
jgi:hypothetical protein